MDRITVKSQSLSMLMIMAMLFVFGCQPMNKTNDNAGESSAWQTASGEQVKKGVPLVFPQDHGAHQKQGIEWWYLTANLTATTGETFGVQWTLFRTLMPMVNMPMVNAGEKLKEPSNKDNSTQTQFNWWDNNLYFAHFAVQHQQQHVAFERFARAGQASVRHSPFVAEIDNWQLASQGSSFLPLTLNAADGDYRLNISLSDSPRVLHGEQGYSQKTGAGHASYYYSYPFLAVNGELTFAGKKYQVSGNAWYDREWSASLLSQEQLGWDWFSLVQDEASQNAHENMSAKVHHKESADYVKGLMVFCIRGAAQTYDYCSGSKISKRGEVSHINQGDVDINVVDTVTLDGRKYPRKWQIKVRDMPAISIETITRDSRNQLTFPYWEGRVKASGGFNGVGYAELTGY
ncbi:lipocalin-like domain-containing protein [Thalassotalea euphylliae]|uniref:ABC transporter n=1 Tax=Thalassotalea euphylliae TaxID=1655234 RepID=A0A3E0UGS0_9GAMM|nr:lipocalin-like domain-containing protein [Thalassotalea euphylliae]REL35365.1 ABC transporter [Thalassotalea euphylliae]